MKIGIIDADLLDKGTRHPNLALMKISGYYKDLNYSVKLLTSYSDLDKYDKVYISKVFTFTRIPDKAVLSLPNVIYGGTGFFEDGGADLPLEIEHHMPDYNLYRDYIDEQIRNGRKKEYYSDYLDYSIGFTTRGCFRKCEFCVNKKYDKAVKHSPVSEFLDVKKPFIYLWDDNVLAYSGWREIFDELDATGKPFQFRQGLDLRLMNEERAARISKSKYHGDFIFAFDHIEDREIIEKKLKLWKQYTNRTTKLYLLCAYDSIDITDIVNTFERIKILMKYGCLPYIMRYESYKQSKFRSLYTELARWCNQPQFFKKKSFRQFCEANQAVHKNQATNCSAYQALLDFEAEYPDIAKEYFDLSFEKENNYHVPLGFGKKYANKKDCDVCESQKQSWVDAYSGKKTPREIIEMYYSQEIDLECLHYSDSRCKDKIDPAELVSWFGTLLINTSWEDLISYVIDSNSSNYSWKDKITPENIPQISNLDDALIETPYHMYVGERELTYSKLGYHLDNGKIKNIIAQRKYGENHAKLASQLDLVTLVKDGNTYYIQGTVFGEYYHNFPNNVKKELAAKLMLRIPIIQEIFRDARMGVVYVDDYLKSLSEATIIRRRPNIMTLLDFIKMESNNYTVKEIFENILIGRKT